MNTKFNCPHCNAAVEAEAEKAGMAGDCPACGELLVIPSARIQKESTPVAPPAAKPPLPKAVPQEDNSWLYEAPKRPSATPPPAAPRPTAASPKKDKTATGYAADAICATFKFGWKATKFVAPIVGKAALAVARPVAKVGLEVTGRGVKAAVESKPAKAVAEGVKEVFRPPVKPPSKITQAARTCYWIMRLFGG